MGQLQKIIPVVSNNNIHRWIVRQINSKNLGALCSLCAAIFLIAASTQFMAHGILIFGSTDLGSAVAGRYLPFQLEIINLNPFSIGLQSVPTCGCTRLEPKRAQLTPLHIVNLHGLVHVPLTAHGILTKPFYLIFTSYKGTWCNVPKIKVRVS
jgi:hypothetical protein